jgi:hypothetical protein
MHPKYQTLAVKLGLKLDDFQANIGPLPGIASQGAKDTLVAQFIESRRKIDRAKALASKALSPERCDPSSSRFDPELAAARLFQAGDIENAVWLAFLSVHFGRHGKDGWLLCSQIYSALTSDPVWTWEAVTDDLSGFESWLWNDANFKGVRLGRFGNHRKYESVTSRTSSGTAAAVRTYVEWIKKHGSHSGLLAETKRMTNGDPMRSFRFLYNEMNVVKRFGRLGKFDFLTLLEKLGLAEIEADSTYMKGATGPAQGARLLFDNDRMSSTSTEVLENQLSNLDVFLGIGMQAIEDSLCNWQKSPNKFLVFRG